MSRVLFFFFGFFGFLEVFDDFGVSFCFFVVFLFGDGSGGVLWLYWFQCVFKMVPDECCDISV